MQEKKASEWTKKELMQLPVRGWNEDIGQFDSLIILPTRKKHDSGFLMMDFVAVIAGIPKIRLSGCSDVLHIDGIVGYGKFNGVNIPSLIPAKGWSIDCLPKSGLLQIFNHNKLSAGEALSSFDLYSEKAL